MSGEKITVLLADDHPVTRKGIAALLRTRGEFEVVAEVDDGQEAIERTRELQPRVVVLDLMMPNVSGLEAARVIHAEFPRIGILILTGYSNEQQLYGTIEAGASGYVLKSAEIEELAKAIHTIAQGKRYFSSELQELMVNGYLQRAQNARKKHETTVALTQREREILKLVAEGFTNQMIAEQLFISPRTVDTHRTNLMKKLGLHDVVSLVRYAVEHGVIELEK
jgi:two-component system response regulator NreC